jgi:AmmeMemoRadiSam system protein B
LFPEAKILPILVEPSPKAVEVGKAVARTVQGCGANVVYVGSTDLTHYGPNYGFVPEGKGEQGIRWAKQVNDRRLIEVIRQMRAEAVIGEVAENHNACGAGAVAATMAACQAHGAKQGALLSHVSSFEVGRDVLGHASNDAVGYAGIVFG